MEGFLSIVINHALILLHYSLILHLFYRLFSEKMLIGQLRDKRLGHGFRDIGDTSRLTTLLHVQSDRSKPYPIVYLSAWSITLLVYSADSYQPRARDHNEPNRKEGEQQTDPKLDLSTQPRASLQRAHHQGNNPSPRSSAHEPTAYIHIPSTSFRKHTVTTREKATDEKNSTSASQKHPLKTSARSENPPPPTTAEP